MKLLALDTSSIACSVALQVGDEVLVRHEEQAREHTKLLLPMIRTLLADAELETSDLDAIVLGNGPGSFIGVRIAASVAQGLAFGAGIGIVPVSSMLAVAAEAAEVHEANEVVVTQDAHMNEVYLGLYRIGQSTVPIAAAEEVLHGQGEIPALRNPAAGRRIAAGFGWQRYPELLATNEALVDEVSDVWHPRAVHLLPAAAEACARGRVVEPEAIVPAYLRQKVAEKPADAQP